MMTLLLILIPLILAAVSLAITDRKILKIFVLSGAIVEFILALAALVSLKSGLSPAGHTLPDFLMPVGITLNFSLDGIGLLLVLMTTFLIPLIILSTFHHHYHQPNSFYALIFVMETALVGVFSSFDGLLFYIFWEMALIPAWLICARWGGNDRIRITFKFFIYTFAGSLLMLIAILYVFMKTPAPHSFGWEQLTSVPLTDVEQRWVFIAFFIAFAIKIPIFPFHTWQPDVYTESAPAGGMLLAGIMLKMGLFGILRWLMPLAPQALQELGPWAISLSVAGVVYGSVIAIRQNDIKRLIAYSSIAHVGLIAAGLFTFTQLALQGAVIQMVSHGVNIVGIFIIADAIERRTKTRKIGELGGLARQTPVLAIFFLIILLGSIALPLTNGFIGEFLLLLGLFEYHPAFAAIAGLTIILGAVYMLWMYQRVMFGEIKAVDSDIQDLGPAEVVSLIPILIVILWTGIFPSGITSIYMNDILLIFNR